MKSKTHPQANHAAHQLTKKHGSRLVRRAPGPLALEQRFMFDGAAVADAVDTAQQTTDTGGDAGAHLLQIAAADGQTVSSALVAAQAEAERLVGEFLNSPDAQSQLFALFQGNQGSEPSAAWLAAVDQLMATFREGDTPVRVELRSNAELQGSKGAFSLNGTTGEATIYLNADWLTGSGDEIAGADIASITTVLVEELGHYLDARLNDGADTAGDEGEAFSRFIIDGTDPSAVSYLSAQDDSGTLQIDGQLVTAEFADFTFVNAYEMVYDLNNSTNGLGVVTGAIDTSERWADKEQNLHYFNSSVSLGQVQVLDGTGNQNFSGNDVSATSIIIGGNTYYGWISRPIKANGVVRGFYFWTDANFTDFATAQADGNQDGDRNILDNRGFLLVVDQSWFDSQISGAPSYAINNLKDGNLGTVAVASIGSSSDRVDSAINSLLVPNSPPVAANDSLTIGEDSGTTSVSAANGLLKNDTDVNNNGLTITGFTVNGVTTTLSSNTGTYAISGVGSITINGDGSYSFTPVSNYAGSVPPITYIVSDGKGGSATATLSITVTPVNDLPTASNDSITTSENTPKLLTLDDFGTFSDPENDPLAKIQITGLATDGVLQYWDGASWSAVTANQEITVAQILLGQLRFAPDAGESGSNYATLQFKVSDGQAYSTNAYTLTVNVTAGNQAPVANADTNSVTEAGCGVAAAPATGNVITGGTADTDANGGTLSVTGITAYGNAQAVNAGTTSGNGTAIVGQYGTLTIGADGSYAYVLNNSLAAIDAMNSGDTKTETFSYTLSDGQGGTATTTLTLTINGTNDAPVGVDDFASLEEGSNQSSGNYGTVTVAANGVLANDLDVDNANNQLQVKLVDGTQPPTTSDVSLSASSPISSVTLVVTQISGSWTAIVPTSPAQPVWLDAARTNPALDKTGAQLTVYRSGSGGSATLVFSDNVALYNYENISLYVKDPGNNNVATFSIDITSATTSASATISSASSISGITAGFEVTGTGIPAGTTVLSVDSVNKTITLSQAVNIANTTLTFHDPNAITLSATQEYMAGTYGYLILDQNGGYTYTLTTDLTATQVVTESFTYTVVDPANGCTGTATINIRAYGVDAPTLVNDTLVVSESTGSHVTFNGAASGSDSVKANDLNGTGGSPITLGDVVSFKVAGDNTTYTAGNSATIAGVGVLTINADGSIAFDPVDNYLGPVPTVTYTRTGSDSLPYTANLSISIQAVDDASSLAPDTKTIDEDTVASGNVLANDSDIDSVLSVSSFAVTGMGATPTVGVPFSITDGSGAVGTLTLNSNGSYTFTPAANWNGAVPQITYTTNTGVSSTLNITVNPVNDPPTLDLDGNNSSTATGNNFKQAYTTGAGGVSIADTDVAIADMDDTHIDSAVIVLTNPQSGDALTVGALPGGIAVSGPTTSGGVITVTLTGSATLADYQAAIQAITFASSGVSTVDRVLSVKVNDGDADSNTAYTTIAVSPNNGALTVNGTTVNEASPYVQFQVGGAAGQWVSLALGETGSGSGNATMGTDFLPNLQYFNGTSWVDYTGSAVQIPTGGSVLLVRTPVLQDLAYEGAETLKLTATNQAGSATSGNSTIIDDGTGSIFLGNNTTATPNNPGDTDPSGPDYPSYLDDDRPVTVNSIVVNEASPWAMFTVSGYAGQQLSLALHDGTATIGDGIPADGTEDYGTGLEYWNGSAWTSYGSSVTLTGSTLLVRTAIHQDSLFEGQHSFSLGVTKLSSGNTVYGIADIYDDGTGSKYEFDDVNDGTATITSGPGTGFDDDRTLSVDSPNVNEASDYVVFTLTGNSGQTVSLALVEESGAGKANIDENQVLKIWDGLDWVDYKASNLPTFDANGKIFVRVDIRAEQDAPYEGPETFKLNATLSGQSTVVTGTATIYDDGTQVKYPGTFSGGSPVTDSTSLDNDLSGSVAVTAHGPVNEGSTYAMFTVDATAGWVLNLALGNTASTADVDATISGFTTVEYSTDGTNWTTYTWNGSTGNRPTAPASGKVYVRVTITSEIDTTYEGPETFTLTATNANNTVKTGTGTSTIIDDGTGTKYGPDMSGGTPTTNTTSLDDDRPSFSVNDVTVNEAAGTLTFTVTKTGTTLLASSVDYATADGTALAGSDYMATSGTLNFAAGETSKTVTVSITNDSIYERSEAFTLNLSAATNGVIGDNQGTGTIKDDGTSANDGRALTINNISVNEGSPYGVFTITATIGETLTLALADGSANGSGTDYGTTGADGHVALQYSTDGGTNWINYTAAITVPGTGTGVATLLVRSSITNDTNYEGAETLTLTAAYTSGLARLQTGTATIRDDGTGNWFDGTGGTGSSTAPTGFELDDDRAVSITAYGPVNEGSTYAMFTVGATPGQVLNLTLGNTASTADQDATIAGFTSLEFSSDGSNWTTYSSASKPTVPAGGKVYVRVKIISEADAPYEGAETFTLTAANVSNLAKTATAISTIIDDGTGTKYGPNMPAGTPQTDTTALDDDRPVTSSSPVTPVPPVPPSTPPASPVPPEPVAVVPPVEPAPVPPPVNSGFDSALPSPSATIVVPPSPDNLIAPVVNDLAVQQAVRSSSIGDVYTSSTGFRVVVIEAPEPTLTLFRGVADQYADAGSSSNFSIPYDAFAHTDPNERISLSATQADGTKLPNWVRFDARSGKFEFNIPGDYRGELKIKITARDSKGNEVSTLFRFSIGDKSLGRDGRAGLSEQLRMAGRQSAWARPGMASLHGDMSGNRARG